MGRARLLAAAVLAALLLAACGSGDTETGTDTTALSSDAAASLQAAFDKGAELDSGILKLAITAAVDQKGGSGDAGGTLTVGMKGPFAGGENPGFSLDTTVKMTNTDPDALSVSGPYNGTLVSTGGSGFLIYDQYAPLTGNYEFDSSLQDLINEVITTIPETPSVITNAKFSDADDGLGTAVPGEDVTQVTGDIDTAALGEAINSAVGTAGDLGFGLDPATELPSQRVDALADTIDSATAVFSVGEDSGLVRRVVINAELSGVDTEAVRIEIDSQVQSPNEQVDIEPPTDTEPLSDLLAKIQQIFTALAG